MKRFGFLLAAIGLGALLVTVGEGSMRLLERPFPGFLIEDNGRLAAFHEDPWTGAKAGLPLGTGRVVAVDGEPFAGAAALLDHAGSRPPGTEIRYRVVSGDREAVIAVPTMWLGRSGYLASFGADLFNALCFAAIGLIALRRRPDSLQARRLAWFSLAVAGLFLLAIDQWSACRLVPVFQVGEAAASLAVFGLASSFPFPRGSASLRRKSAIALAVIGLVIFGAQSALFYRAPEAAQIVTLTTYVLFSLVVLLLLAGLATAALGAPDPVDRVRSEIVLAAVVSGLVVPALAIVAFAALAGRSSFPWVPLLLPVFPAVVLFSILRRDLIRAERTARVAVGYALATAATAVGYGALLVAYDRLVGGDVAQSVHAQFVLLMAVAFCFQPVYRRVQNTIDQRFYRMQLDPSRVLERMSLLLAARVGEDEVAGIVEREVISALAVEWVALASPEAAGDRSPSLEEPVVYHGELLGNLQIGRKVLGAPFSEQESDLIVGVASQAATAIHNARSSRDLRNTQQALVEAERLAAIGEVAGAVAHGLRNPLAGIRAAAQMAQEIDDPAELNEALGDLIQGTDRLDARVRRLLDFARMLEPDLAPIDVALVIEDVRATLSTNAARGGVDLSVDVEPGLHAFADAGQLAEAVIELASNALRATRQGGRVEIRAAQNGSEVLIAVDDNGCGIPEQVQARVFDLFFTTHETGTGMGLATVKKMLERQGGWVRLVESSPSGTSFHAGLQRA